MAGVKTPRGAGTWIRDRKTGLYYRPEDPDCPKHPKHASTKKTKGFSAKTETMTEKVGGEQ